MEFGEPKKPSQKKKLVSSGTAGPEDDRELMDDVVDLYSILKKQGLSLDNDSKNSKLSNCYTKKTEELSIGQQIGNEKKSKQRKTVSFSSGGVGGECVGAPQKSSMGNENPDFQEFVIVPSKKKWGDDDNSDRNKNQNNEQIQNNSIKDIEYKDKNYVLRIVGEGQPQQQSKSQKKYQEQEEQEIQPTKKQQKSLEQIEQEKQEAFMTKNKDLIEKKIQEEETQKVQEIQKKIVDLMIQQPDETSDKNPNRPSKQLDHFQYYESFLEDEKKKEEENKNTKTGFRMPAMYSNQNNTSNNNPQGQQNEEENQDSQGNNEEEEYHEEKDTNDSEAYGGMYEISRELVSENIEKKEKIYKIKYNNNDMYEGEIDEKTQLKDGWGTYFYGNGEKYEGFFEDDLINGYGKYWFLGGHYYEGDWYDGLKQGVGELTFNNKDKYEGSFYQDNFHGHGIFKYHNGDVFDGNWDEGKKSGKGCFKTQGAKGRTMIGVWVNDELQQF